MDGKVENKYFERELSWLSFNYRVLQEAKDSRVPILERLKFLAIYSSNLDEFIRVRVAFLRSLMEIKRIKSEELGFKPGRLLDKINAVIRAQQAEFEHILLDQLVPELKQYSVHLVTSDEITSAETKFVIDYFHKYVEEFTVAINIGKGCRKPFLKNSHLYMVIKLQPKGEAEAPYQYSIISIPSEKMSRFLSLPVKNKQHRIMVLGDVMRVAATDMYKDMEIVLCHSIKLSRDAELYMDEYSGNLVDIIRRSLRKRATGLPSRFMYDSTMPMDTLLMLMDMLNLHDYDLIPGARYHNMHDFFKFPNPDKVLPVFPPAPALENPVFTGIDSYFDLLSKQDVAMHYPYQRFDYFVNFLNQAAHDPTVREIKMTLYRVTQDSPVMRILIEAANLGKEVTVFFEVKARFDERTNLYWAEKLENVGAKVLYSLPGIKVHTKMCLVAREEKHEMKYYGYFSTGNFNEITAHVYADDAIFTADQQITSEMDDLFAYLEGGAGLPQLEHILLAPDQLRTRLEELIDYEINEANRGRKAIITLKLNNLEDKPIIDKLYEASNAGVKVRLIIRGICCLIPGVKGMSENIKVVSIVGRYLEHSRIYLFYHSGEEKMYISSADWMRRNLTNRIETAFPVYDVKIKKQLAAIIRLQLNDNVKARKINKKQDNPYRRTKSKVPVNAQEITYQYFKEVALHQPAKQFNKK